MGRVERVGRVGRGGVGVAIFWAISVLISF